MGNPKFPGWRTMSHVERRNAKMHAIFERAREAGVTGLYSGPADQRATDAEIEQDLRDQIANNGDC